MKVYISTAPAGDERSAADVIARIEELKERLQYKFDDACECFSHLDCKAEGKFADKVGGNIAILMNCDAILLDDKAHKSRSCHIEEAVAKCIATWKKNFAFFHTREEFDYVYEKYTI